MKKTLLVLLFLLVGAIIIACTPTEIQQKYIVTFHPNNGESTSQVEVEKDGLIPTQTDPIKDGFSFNGWYKDEAFNEEWTFETMKVTSNMDLYAAYDENKAHTVTFNSNDGSQVPSVSVDEGDLLVLPAAPTKEGMRFAGWYKNTSFSQQWNFNKDEVLADTTLHAKWKVEKDYSEGIKILSVGNSFSEDAHRYLWQILASAGIPEDKIVVANMYIGGAELVGHFNNANTGSKNYTYQLFKGPNKVDTQSVSLNEAIVAEYWDVITFQQASHHSGLSATYESYLFDLMRWAEALAINPDVELGWHMTWAYQQTSNHSGFANYNHSQSTMYEMIVESVLKEVHNVSQLEFVIPSGTAIQNARTSYVGDRLTADGYHLTDPLGRYIAALTFYKQITGLELSLEKVAFRPNGVQSEDQLMAYEAVNNAYNKPFEVTNSTYTVAPEPEPIEVTGELFEYTLIPGYWNSGATSVTNTGGSFDLQFAASNVIPKGLLPVGSEIVVEPGYKYRVIFLEKENDGFRVVHRTDNISTSYTVIDAAFWGSYQYIAFNVSNNDGTTIDQMLETVMTKFRLYHPEGTELGHMDEPLHFESGIYEMDGTAMIDADHSFVSNPVSMAYFNKDHIVNVAAGYQFRYVTLVYENGYLVTYLSAWQTENLLIDDVFKADKELVAFIVTKDEIEDISQIDVSTIITIAPQAVPHVNQELFFTKGYWNNGGTAITSADTTADSFIASNVLSKAGLMGAVSFTLETGYQARVIFLTYDGLGNYLVIHRTNNYTGTMTMDDTFWGTYEYIAFNLSTTPTSNITERLEEVSSKISFDFDLEFQKGYWNNNATTITATDSTANSYIASTPVARTLIPVGTTLVLEAGYKVRIIFLSYDEQTGFKVLERTGAEYQNSVVLADYFYKDFQYIAFNLSTAPTTNITEHLEEVASKLTLERFDDEIINHVDNLTFNQGFWTDHAIAPAPTTDGLYNNFIVSSTLSKAYFETIESFTIGDGYMVRVIFLDYEYNQYKVIVRTVTFTGTVAMDEAFWGAYKYVAFNISKSPAVNLNGEVEATAAQFTFNSIVL